MRVEKKYNDDLFIFHEINRIVEYISNLLKIKFKNQEEAFKNQEEPLPGLSKVYIYFKYILLLIFLFHITIFLFAQ